VDKNPYPTRMTQYDLKFKLTQGYQNTKCV
jgi:hypothetical protein